MILGATGAVDGARAAVCFGGSGLATQKSPSAWLSDGHTSGHTRLLIPRTASIAFTDTASDVETEVSLIK
ncbi:MAG: hypothetical protein WBE84_23485, partial [Xanthobacteraceae bacterium]